MVNGIGSTATPRVYAVSGVMLEWLSVAIATFFIIIVPPCMIINTF